MSVVVFDLPLVFVEDDEVLLSRHSRAPTCVSPLIKISYARLSCPFWRASDSPMAIACFLLVTFFPLPLFRVPLSRRRIADFKRP